MAEGDLKCLIILLPLILLPHRPDPGFTGVPTTPDPCSTKALHVLGKPLLLPMSPPKNELPVAFSLVHHVSNELPSLLSPLPWAALPTGNRSCSLPSFYSIAHHGTKELRCLSQEKGQVPEHTSPRAPSHSGGDMPGAVHKETLKFLLCCLLGHIWNLSPKKPFEKTEVLFQLIPVQGDCCGVESDHGLLLRRTRGISLAAVLPE